MSGGERAQPGRVVPNGIASDLHGLGREHVKEIQRGRLLAAMMEICAQRGAGTATVADVVERAGVSRRTFYELFADREECFLAAFDEGVARVTRYALAGHDPGAGWVERIRTALIALLQYLDAEPGMGQMLLVGSLGAGPTALERREHVLAQAIAVVDEGRIEARTGSELPPLTAEGIVGGALSILHSRFVGDDPGALVELTGPLMSMIVLPYRGPAAARKELARPVPCSPHKVSTVDGNPLRELGMRLTYRTVSVLMTVAARPGSSNREVADSSGITDQGQISKLLARLHGLGLIENTDAGPAPGGPNAWVLTVRGAEVQRAMSSGSHLEVRL
jgi:AcrR family transcriptional regulator